MPHTKKKTLGIVLLKWKYDIRPYINNITFGRTSSQLPSPQKSKAPVKSFRNFILSLTHLLQIRIVHNCFKYLLHLQSCFSFESITFLKGNDLLK